MTITALAASLVVNACSSKSKDHITVTIGEEGIPAYVTDKAVEQEIYEHLYAIYELRRTAAEQYVAYKLGCVNCDIDSLMEANNARIMLSEPIAPKMRIDSMWCQTKGPSDAKVTLTCISDYECSKCRDTYQGMKALMDKYAENIKIEQSTFAAEPTIAARAAYAASLQNAFWQMHEKLMTAPLPIDDKTVCKAAMECELDMETFVADINDESTIASIAKNNQYLHNRGIYGTPTVMINHRIIRNTKDIGNIDNEIAKAIGR